MNSGIYIIKNMVNGKVYVGSTNNIKVRKYRHFNNLRKNKHLNKHLQFAFNKYGESNFEYRLIVYCTEDKLLEKESFYINHFNSTNRNNGYNIEKAERTTMSDETKAKISKALTGRICPPRSYEIRNKISKGMLGLQNAKGYKHSSDAKTKISQSLIGRVRPPMSKEQKSKLSIVNIGKHHSEETIKKMIESQRKRRLMEITK